MRPKEGTIIKAKTNKAVDAASTKPVRRIEKVSQGKYSRLKKRATQGSVSGK